MAGLWEASRGRAVASCPSSSSPPPSPSFPPSLPLQVRISLGTHILSAMAAFAGTAILLMDFGVTNWVCVVRRPQEWENLKKSNSHIQEQARVGEGRL